LKIYEPAVAEIDLATAEMSKYNSKVDRKLSDMHGLYQDVEATDKMLETGDPVTYIYYALEQPSEVGQLTFGTTIIYPGKVGDEYFMTKGHLHEKENYSEIYVCVAGKGILLMQTRQGGVKWVTLTRGDSLYIPPHWAHRSVNIGDDNFAYIYVLPADSGHHFDTIVEKGFAKLVVEKDGKPAVVDNPNHIPW